MQSQLSGRRDNFSISATSAVSPRWRRRDQSQLAARALGQWARGTVAAPGTAKYRQLSRSSWANGAIRIYSGNWREIYCVFWSGTFCHVKLKEGEREIKWKKNWESDPLFWEQPLIFIQLKLHFLFRSNFLNFHKIQWITNFHEHFANNSNKSTNIKWCWTILNLTSQNNLHKWSLFFSWCNLSLCLSFM